LVRLPRLFIVQFTAAASMASLRAVARDRLRRPLTRRPLPRIRRPWGKTGAEQAIRIGESTAPGPDRQLDPHLASLLVMDQLPIVLRIRIGSRVRFIPRCIKHLVEPGEKVLASGSLYFLAHLYNCGTPAHRIKYGGPVLPA
jgi:hypothetical protein